MGSLDTWEANRKMLDEMRDKGDDVEIQLVSKTVTKAVKLICDCGEPWVVIDDEGSIGVPTCRCDDDSYDFYPGKWYHVPEQHKEPELTIPLGGSAVFETVEGGYDVSNMSDGCVVHLRDPDFEPVVDRVAVDAWQRWLGDSKDMWATSYENALVVINGDYVLNESKDEFAENPLEDIKPLVTGRSGIDWDKEPITVKIAVPPEGLQSRWWIRQYDAEKNKREVLEEENRRLEAALDGVRKQYRCYRRIITLRDGSRREDRIPGE